MCSQLSLDLRQRAVDAYLAGDRTLDEVAARFAIGRASLVRWLRRQRQTGSPAAAVWKRGPKGRVGLDEELALRQVVEEQPDATLRELGEAFAARTGVPLTPSSIDRHVRRLGLTRKKKTCTRPSATARR
jgi:transposase